MKKKTFKLKTKKLNPAALISLLILVVLLLAGLWAVQNTLQTRGEAARQNCLNEGRRGCYTTPCCTGLNCKSNKCVRGTTPPTSGPATITLSTPTPSECVMNRIGCGPINCGSMTCEAGSACYQNSCYPTNTVCTVEAACPAKPSGPTSVPATITLSTPTPTTPGCTYSYRNVGCGPRQCGGNYCQKKYMCREQRRTCGGRTTVGYFCEYGYGCR